MNRKIDLLYGALIAFVASTVGAWLFLTIFTDYAFGQGIKLLYNGGKLGKIIALGAILNVIAFFILLRNKRELMARGVILGTIILAVITLLI